MTQRPGATDAPATILWGEDGAAVVSSAPAQAVREVGWIPGLPPGAGILNWLLRAFSRQLAYLMAHTADVPAGDRWGYDATVLPTFQLSALPHTWKILIGTQDISVAIPLVGGPTRLQPSSGAALIAVYDLTPHFAQILLHPGGSITPRVKRIRARWKCVAAADEVTVVLYKQPRAASGIAEEVVGMTVGSAEVTDFTEAVSSEVDVELDATYTYWLTAILDADSTASNVALETVSVEYTKKAVE